MCAGRKPDEQHAGMRIAKPGHRGSVVRRVAKSTLANARDFCGVCAQFRAARARGKIVVDEREGVDACLLA